MRRKRERFGEKKEEEETNYIIKVWVKGQRKELRIVEERDSGWKKFAGGDYSNLQ